MTYRERIKQDEGFSLMVYLDSEENPTCGWGHCFFESPRPAPGTVFSKEQCEEFFEEDMDSVEREYYIELEGRFCIANLDLVRRGVIKNMLFNLGFPKLVGFRRMWDAIERKMWQWAAIEMLDSRWATQVKGRAIRLAKMMEFGKE